MAQGLPRYFFILAHGNLSLAEIVIYLEDQGLNPHIVGHSKDVVAVAVSRLNPNLVMQHLGGSYKMANIICETPLAEALKEDELDLILDSHTFYNDLGDKVNWGVSIYSMKPEVGQKLFHLLEEYFRQRLKREGVKKARYILPRRPSPSREREEAELEVLSEKVLERGMIWEGFEVIASAIDGMIYFGRTLAVVDHQGFRERDFGRPVQKPILSMPPKLARVLVNLSGVRPGGVLLDPFCGIGTILAEALMMKMDIRGVDIDARRVSETRLNLDWIVNRYHLLRNGLKEKVLQGDTRSLSSYLKEGSIDGIATEPILLPPLRQHPSSKDALKMLSNAEKVYSTALVEMAKVLKKSGRIAIVMPYVQTQEGDLLSFQVNTLSENVRLKPYRPRIATSWRYPLFAKAEGGQKVIRGVYVLEKE